MPDLTVRTAVSLLIKTGLRILDATRLPFDPVVLDAAGAPVLLYYDHKLKRDAAMPIDDVLLALRERGDRRAASRHASPWPASEQAASARCYALIAVSSLSRRRIARANSIGWS